MIDYWLKDVETTIPDTLVPRIGESTGRYKPEFANRSPWNSKRIHQNQTIN